MQKIEETRHSNVTKRDHRYIVVKELPSNFRSYDTDTVYVRGLTWGEANSLSALVAEGSYTELANIYNDVIDGVPVPELEVMDFILLMEISTIWTSRKNGWVPNVRCPHIHKQEDGNFKRCNGVITEPITLSDLHITPSDIAEKEIPTGIKYKDEEIILHPLTVQDLINIEQKVKQGKDETICSYAYMISNDLSFEDKYDFIQYGEAEEIGAIEQIDSELDVEIEPIKKVCPDCDKEVKLEIRLNNLKAYP